MNQCVPNWDLDDNPNLIRRSHSNSLSLTPNDPELDNEVAELTWENGQLSMHGLGPRRVPSKSQAIFHHAKYYLDKPRAAGGTLESIVDQATFFTPYETTTDSSLGGGISTGTEFVPWLNHQRSITRPTSATMAIAFAATMTMDALVPCTNNNSNKNKKEAASMHVGESGVGTYGVGCSTRVGSVEKGRVTRAAAAPYDWGNCRDQSVTGSATFSRQLTLDPCDKEFGVRGFTSTSVRSLGNTSSGKQLTGDDHDSACHSRPQIRVAGHEEAKTKENGKSSISTKRSRVAAVHNQSERKRRDKINQRIKTLQKLVPNSNKTDKASMLDEVIEYLRQLQGQVNVIRTMNMSPMMLPLTMQQQLQMSMMAPMMGMGMGVMDINGGSMTGRPIIAGMPPVLNPAAFMSPLASWDQGTADRLQPPASVIPDSMSTFLVACQQQPMTMDAYSRMAAMYQRLQQNPGPGAKN